MRPERCFHCSEPNPERAPMARIAGVERYFCCHGCLAVASFIDSSGLQAFYQRRSEQSKPAPYAATNAFDLSAYDRPSFQRGFVDRRPDSADCEARLTIDGVNCGACSWLIRKAVSEIEGVRAVEVNPATGWAHIVFDSGQAKLSQIVGRIAKLGYQPAPASEDRQTARWLQQRRKALARLAVAGFGMMQVMTYAVAMYAGAFSGIDANTEHFLRLISLIVTTPVVFYSAVPFFTRAWAAVRKRSMSMDIPVSAAILIAYVLSVAHTFLQVGDVYFDSIVMFVFLLSVARFLVGGLNQRTRTDGLSIDSATPSLCRRFCDQRLVTVGVDELEVGDVIAVDRGELVPADGQLMDAHQPAHLQQAWLSGESRVVKVKPGDRVLAGSRNVGDAVKLRVVAIGEQRSISQIKALYQRALAKQPPAIEQIDALARWFVSIVLGVALLGGILWTAFGGYAKGLEIMVAVLIVSCPCALSLATPAALAAVSGALIRRGILLAEPAAIENLSAIQRLVLDKTGSLTTGQLAVEAIHTPPNVDVEWLKTVAASLEQRSSHPIAMALSGLAAPIAVTAWQERIGGGVQGTLAGARYRIGQPDFVGANDAERQALGEVASDRTVVWVGSDVHGLLGRIELADRLRPGVPSVVQYFSSLGMKISILSGDDEAIVREVAEHCAVDEYFSRVSPSQKLAQIEAWQTDQQRVLFVGDGINDAPALAQAAVGVAMGSGSAMSRSGADVILLNDDLSDLVELSTIADKGRALIRQNLWWAGGYNVMIIPAALAGLVPPWLAAVGMSLSSLVVVLNSFRGRRLSSSSRA